MFFYSKLNDSLEIIPKDSEGKGKAVVSVGKSPGFNHYSIIIESLPSNKNESYQIMIADFLPKNLGWLGTSTLSMMIGNGVYDAEIRVHTNLGCHSMTWEEIAKERDDRELSGFREPYLRFININSWQIDYETSRQLKRKIAEDEQRAMDGNLKFNIYGINAPEIFTKAHHNDSTWVQEKMAGIGINLELLPPIPLGHNCVIS
jgi:hypothetical protein